MWVGTSKERKMSLRNYTEVRREKEE